MSRLETTFAELKQRGDAAFVPFITAGDPNLERTADVIRTLASSGADIIELGIPFSDPMADGPTIQAASERALASGTTLAKVLQLVATVRAEVKIPLVLMGYYNPVFHYGIEQFVRDAHAAGVDGLLLVDLPPEEAGEVLPALDAVDIPLITLLAPTTPPQRMRQLAGCARGYIYYVSMTGVTGTQTVVPQEIRRAVEELKTMTEVPVAVGFGINTAADAQAVAAFADAVVVGSALVRIIAEQGDSAGLVPAVAAFAAELKDAVLCQR